MTCDTDAMTVFAVHYTYTDDAEGRDAHRADHRAFLRSLAVDGAVLLAGAYPEQEGVQPAALLVVRAESADEARIVLTEDPFQREGLVATVDVRPWAPPMGAWVEGDDAPLAGRF